MSTRQDTGRSQNTGQQKTALTFSCCPSKSPLWAGLPSASGRTGTAPGLLGPFQLVRCLPATAHRAGGAAAVGEGELGGVPCSWHCCAWHSSSARIRGSWGLLWFLERPPTRGLSAAVGQLRRTLLSGWSLALPSLVPSVSGASSLFSGLQAPPGGPALHETCTFDPPCGLVRGTSHTQPYCLQELQVQPLLLGFPECRETPAFCAPPAQEAGGKPPQGSSWSPSHWAQGGNMGLAARPSEETLLPA